MSDLTEKKCVPCEGGTRPLNKEQIQKLLHDIPGWEIDESGVHAISRVFDFKNFYHVMAFVNAVAWIAHRENHHPDIDIGYNKCTVRYSTHAIDGLSENDFICAAKVNALLS